MLRWLLAVALLSLGVFCALLGSYFAWKFFALYLPNKASVDACLPSGGTCSIDGMANLEISGWWTAALFAIGCACAWGVIAVLRTRTATE
jgi:hypothetical protein